MQHATQQLGVPLARPSITPGAAYAYDIEYRTGRVVATYELVDIGSVPVADTAMGNSFVCRGPLAAAVSTATGGDVVGSDMYGQTISETIAALGTSKYTYAAITSAPADAVWENTFGLPYKWASGAGYNAPAADGDPRGTVDFDFSGGNTLELDYIADTTQLHGQPLAERFASPSPIAPAAYTGTISAAGEIAITKVAIADGSASVSLIMPDGVTIPAANDTTPVAYNLPPLWMSEYADNLNDGLATELVRGVTAAGTKIVVTLTGAGIPDPVVEDEPDPAPVDDGGEE